jgi:hypothetical protein
MRVCLGLVAGGMMAVTLASDPARGAELAWKALDVRVYDTAGVPKAAMRAALDTAAQAVQPAGLEVTWLACSVSSGGRCLEPLRRGELMVRLVRSAAARPGDEESLGTALVDPHTGTGVLATVFVDRVEQLARRADGGLGTLLGRAMAHEIGHLLMGVAGHAARGLMRPRWTRAEVTRNATADWRFDAPELRAISRSRQFRGR